MFRRTIFSGLFLLVSAWSAFAQRTDTARDKRLAEYRQRIGYTYSDAYRLAAQIPLGKPIGEFEAFVLAAAYFFSHINGCGAVELPTDKGDRWVAESGVGYTAADGPQVIVEKNTGITYSPGKPKITDPQEYLKFVRNPAADSPKPIAMRVVDDNGFIWHGNELTYLHVFDIGGRRVKTVTEFKEAISALPPGTEVFWDSGCLGYTTLPVSGPLTTIKALQEFCAERGVTFSHRISGY